MYKVGSTHQALITAKTSRNTPKNPPHLKLAGNAGLLSKGALTLQLHFCHVAGVSVATTMETLTDLSGFSFHLGTACKPCVRHFVEPKTRISYVIDRSSRDHVPLDGRVVLVDEVSRLRENLVFGSRLVTCLHRRRTHEDRPGTRPAVTAGLDELEMEIHMEVLRERDHKNM